MKIGVLQEGFASAFLDAAVDEKCRAAIAKLETLGATMEEVSVPL
jgi:amidase